MSLRKLAAAPLAGSVAVVAHVAGFGFDHAPGGARSPELLGSLAAAMLLGMLGIFFRATLGRPPAAIATAAARRKSVAGLAAAGFAAYVLIELLEGHFSLAGGLRALAATLPAAAVLALLARFAVRSIRRAALRFVAFAIAVRARALGALRATGAPLVVPAAMLPARRRSGRAPPLFA